MSGVISNIVQTAYDLAFQVSPIFLVDGIAKGTPGGVLPIVGLTGQVLSAIQGLASNGLSADAFFAKYLPVPGGTVIANTVGMYPFANQQVAANAIIQQPLTVSLLMIAPVKDTLGYLTKLPVFMSLQSSLQTHNNLGGTYTILTPSYVYTNCVMTGMTDASSGESKQQQIQWQLDFIQPLVTKAQAKQAQSSLMSKLSSGASMGVPSWSGLPDTITSSLASIAGAL